MLTSSGVFIFTPPLELIKLVVGTRRAFVEGVSQLRRALRLAECLSSQRGALEWISFGPEPGANEL